MRERGGYEHEADTVLEVSDVARHDTGAVGPGGLEEADAAKPLELHAAMSLGRLGQQQGKHAETRQPLTDIYGWFTEGFDTAALQEAKALLDEAV